jgi:hypothetical protein
VERDGVRHEETREEGMSRRYTPMNADRKLPILVSTIVLVLLGVHSAKGQTATQRPDVYYAMRSQALQMVRAKVGLPAGSTPTAPWGVVMDWGLPNGNVTSTVVAYSDGGASVYLSGGGGYIGGGQTHEAIRKAAQKAVSLAAGLEMKAVATNEYPLPRSGEMIFYLLTDAGVFTASGSQAELSSGRHPFPRLPMRCRPS